MTDDLPTPCCSSCPSPPPLSIQYFSCLVGTRLSILFRSLSHHFPFYPFSTRSSVCVISFLIMFSYQFNRLSVIFLEACANLSLLIMCSFLILSLRVTPYSAAFLPISPSPHSLCEICFHTILLVYNRPEVFQIHE